MILKEARVSNFKCIDDSNEIAIGPITCFVGKNEAGKTALLQALYKLNPVVQGDEGFDPLEYPRRRWADYKERSETIVDPVVATVWQLDETDRAALHETLGPEALRTGDITLTKGYDNALRWFIEVDGQQVLATNEEAIWTLSDRLPKFVYFADYQKLPGAIAIDELLRKKEQGELSFAERIFLALLDLAGSTPEEIQKIGRFERLIAELEAVSNRISAEIFEYWSLNKHLHVDFRCDAARPGDLPPFNSGYVFRTRIRDTRHGVTVSFDERSAGFVWFFSFLVLVSQIRKQYGSNLFILLDEPGLSLHARAQHDLLRYIKERLQPFYQVIYSTHSPFMIDPDNIDSVRTVEDVILGGEVVGAKVQQTLVSTDLDTAFPLQAALGYDLTRSLFVGEQTLLVEGPGDLLYLKWFSRELELQGREYLDPRWVIAPAGGIEKIASFRALFGGDKLRLAVFTDTPHRDRPWTERETELLKGANVFSAEMYAGREEADVEDMLGRPLYTTLVNHCYGLYSSDPIPDRAPEAPPRVVQEVAMHFANLPPGMPEFNHYVPASYLVENTAALRALLPELDQALDRFERLFHDLNRALGPMTAAPGRGAEKLQKTEV